ncbi:MAG: protein phosphatase 2C domain-containing protein [Methanoregula sp.]
MNLTWCGRTHICGRPRNEDAFDMQQIGDHLAAFAVADGLGGLPAGEVASRIAVTALMDTVRTLAPRGMTCTPAQMTEILTKGFAAAAQAIGDDNSLNPDHKEMATTLVAALINDASDGVITYAGDSRAYRGENTLVQITKDHSLVQEMFRKGLITQEEARLHPDKNVVTRVVSEIPVHPDIVEFRMEKNTLLLCTDGLTDALSDEEISLAMKERDVDRICTALIERSRQVNRDNTTIIVIRAAPGS